MAILGKVLTVSFTYLWDGEIKINHWFEFTSEEEMKRALSLSKTPSDLIVPSDLPEVQGQVYLRPHHRSAACRKSKKQGRLLYNDAALNQFRTDKVELLTIQLFV